ncbi:sulfotransferase family 2 domain-containing protein [Nanoarchaeota archaeon]
MGKKNILYVFLHAPKCAGTTIAYHINNNFKKEEVISLYPRHGFYNIAKKKWEYLKINKEDFTRQINDYLASLTSSQKGKIKVIFGHAAFYGVHEFFDKEARYFTFLRDPFDQIASLYKQRKRAVEIGKRIVRDEGCKLPVRIDSSRAEAEISESGKILPFESWVKKKCKNSNKMIEFLIENNFLKANPNEKRIKEALDKFYFIGLNESFEEDSLFIYHKLGINLFFENQNVSRENFGVRKTPELKEWFLSNNVFDKKMYNYAKEINDKFKNRIKNFPEKIKHLKRRRAFFLPFTNRLGHIKGRLIRLRSLLW